MALVLRRCAIAHWRGDWSHAVGAPISARSLREPAVLVYLSADYRLSIAFVINSISEPHPASTVNDNWAIFSVAYS